MAHWLLLNAHIYIKYIRVEVKHVLHCSELINLLCLESDDGLGFRLGHGVVLRPLVPEVLRSSG